MAIPKFNERRPRASVGGIKVYDDHAVQIVHMCLNGIVLHAEVSGDSYTAKCLETGDVATGESRKQALEKLAVIVEVRFNSLAGVVG